MLLWHFLCRIPFLTSPRGHFLDTSQTLPRHFLQKTFPDKYPQRLLADSDEVRPSPGQISRPSLGKLSAVSRPSLGQISRPSLGELSAISRPDLSAIPRPCLGLISAMSRPYLSAMLRPYLHSIHFGFLCLGAALPLAGAFPEPSRSIPAQAVAEDEQAMNSKLIVIGVSSDGPSCERGASSHRAVP